MKHLMSALVPLALVFLLSRCSSSNDNTKDQMSHDHGAGEMHTEMRTEQHNNAMIKNDDLNAVYEQYALLTDAFTKGDVAAAKLSANSIEAGAKEIEGGQEIASAANEIVVSDDIETQRAAYLKMSNALIPLVKNSGMKVGELYVEHCPMAFDNAGGSWISSSKEIRNPYFGDKMMNCGEVTETIK